MLNIRVLLIISIIVIGGCENDMKNGKGGLGCNCDLQETFYDYHIKSAKLVRTNTSLENTLSAKEVIINPAFSLKKGESLSNIDLSTKLNIEIPVKNNSWKYYYEFEIDSTYRKDNQTLYYIAYCAAYYAYHDVSDDCTVRNWKEWYSIQKKLQEQYLSPIAEIKNISLPRATLALVEKSTLQPTGEIEIIPTSALFDLENGGELEMWKENQRFEDYEVLPIAPPDRAITIRLPAGKHYIIRIKNENNECKTIRFNVDDQKLSIPCS